MDYRNKVILAPMVRIGTLPTRLLALKYGADLVYTEEIIDHKILSARRFENAVLGTVDYVLSDTTLVFRTHPLEKSKLVFQMGTADATVALEAAKKIEGDVSAVDINMGCPKEFSIKGGMGAALLKKPDTVKQILTTLVKGLSIPVSCKIRVQPKLEDNLRFVKMVSETGVSALGIHGRLTEERPRHPNRNHTIKQLAESITIPVIANGGSKEIQCYEDIEKFRRATGAESVMIARAAQWNTSIFRKEGKLPVKEVVKDYLKIAIDTDNPFPNTKYCILNLMHADMDQQEGLDTQDAKCIEEICEIWGYTDYLNEARRKRKLKQESIDRYHGIKRRKTEDGCLLIEMPIRFIKKDYPYGVSPKLKLYEWTDKKGVAKPVYDTTERPVDRCFKSVLTVDGKKFTSSLWEKSKQLTEQAAAIIAMVVLGLDDCSKPTTDSPNADVITVWKREFLTESGDDDSFKHKVPSHKCDKGLNAGDSNNITVKSDVVRGTGDANNLSDICDGDYSDTGRSEDTQKSVETCTASDNVEQESKR